MFQPEPNAFRSDSDATLMSADSPPVAKKHLLPALWSFVVLGLALAFWAFSGHLASPNPEVRLIWMQTEPEFTAGTIRNHTNRPLKQVVVEVTNYTVRKVAGFPVGRIPETVRSDILTTRASIEKQSRQLVNGTWRQIVWRQVLVPTNYVEEIPAGYAVDFQVQMPYSKIEKVQVFELAGRERRLMRCLEVGW